MTSLSADIFLLLCPLQSPRLEGCYIDIYKYFNVELDSTFITGGEYFLEFEEKIFKHPCTTSLCESML